MLEQTFWGLLDSQLAAIKSATPSDANLQLLETTKLLLSQLDCSEEVLSQYDKYGIRKLFAAHSDIGTEVTAFYETHKGILDPAAVNGKIGAKLEATSAKLMETAESLKKLQASEEQLLEKERTLEKQKAEYQGLADKVAELKTIAEKVTPDKIAELRDAIPLLQNSIELGRTERDAVQADVERLQHTLDEVQPALDAAQAERAKLEDALLATIEGHYEMLRILYRNHDMELGSIEQSIKTHQMEYERMETAVQEQQETLTFYESWLGENSRLIQALKKYGVKSLDALLNDVEAAKVTIENDLQAYDLLLQKMLVQEEEIRKAVLKRQGKMID